MFHFFIVAKLSYHKENKRVLLISPILATCLNCFELPFCISKANCSFLEKIFLKIATNPSQLVYFCNRDSRVSKPHLNIMSWDICVRLKWRFRFPWRSAGVYQALFFDFTAMLTVCIHNLLAQQQIFCRLCINILSCGRIYTEFASFFFSRLNKKR